MSVNPTGKVCIAQSQSILCEMPGNSLMLLSNLHTVRNGSASIVKHTDDEPASHPAEFKIGTFI